MAQGTIHIKTTKRRSGDVLWDQVWCAACVAEHKKIFAGDKGIVITERPWTGEARPCGSCDDSENAPEFKFSTVVALLLVLLIGGTASAQVVAPQPSSRVVEIVSNGSGNLQTYVLPPDDLAAQSIDQVPLLVQPDARVTSWGALLTVAQIDPADAWIFSLMFGCLFSIGVVGLYQLVVIAVRLKEIIRLLSCVALVLLPSMASAQTAPIIVGNVADAVTTEIAIARGAGREGNPIMGASMSQRVALKAAGTAAEVWLARKLSVRHPKAARVFGYAVGAGFSALAARNLSIVVHR